MKKQTLFAAVIALVSVAATAQQNAEIPFVYDVENTGSHYAAPTMPPADQLPVIRELPDALEGVKKFKDWSKRRSNISHMIQH